MNSSSSTHINSISSLVHLINGPNLTNTRLVYNIIQTRINFTQFAYDCENSLNFIFIIFT